ncbi:hypothetical protein MKX07_008854 [Trichoderma sp. CBMAI-0711]|uniref:Uncharacterized protein n=1 Tax=Trichoderma parareesei TaxID=858221 RepID=A0A2H2ZMK2_TRIPA|nr:hypothetical protein MKX07_008854 [Trichoderma sp. CBMAI-0711]OTA08557.1 hypothetical protein A9Z42_0002620 [Trichoderma parareesei]
MSAPSPEEANLYYYDGIAPGPKLIARTSTNAWEFAARISLPVTKLTHPVLLERFFTPDPDDKDSILIDEILDLLIGQTVRGMTLLHYSSSNQDGWQTVLVITVEAGTLKYKEGYALAMQCKEYFKDHGIYDVECEIREEVTDTDGQVAKAWRDVALACFDNMVDWI